MRRINFASIMAMLTLGAALRPEKHPGKEKIPGVGHGYEHGPARKFYRRATKRSWFGRRTIRNRIARLSRRRNRGTKGRSHTR